MFKYFIFILFFIFLSCSSDLDIKKLKCNTGSDCPYDSICIEKACALKSKSSCVDESSCKIGEDCINKECIVKPCADGDDCPSDFICLNNFCSVASKSQCKDDLNCKFGKICSDGECIIQPCTNGDECLDGFICVDSMCSLSNNSSCKESIDCKSGNFCDTEDGKCKVMPCNKGDDCPDDFICIDELCSLRTESSCYKNMDCKTGEYCINETVCIYEPCKNAGELTLSEDDYRGYTCACVDEHYGENCEYTDWILNIEDNCKGSIAKSCDNGIIQFGGEKNDTGVILLRDNNLNMFVIGETENDLDGERNNGFKDVFISKFDNNNHRVWTKLIGTDGNDSVKDAKFDMNSGKMYVTGSFKDNAFIAQVNTNFGETIWLKEFSSTNSIVGKAVAFDNNQNIYLTGNVNGIFNELETKKLDVFLMKFSNTGELLSSNLYGEEDNDSVGGILILNDMIYLYMNSLDDIFLGKDVFLKKLNLNGDEIWSKEFGTDENDFITSMTYDDNKNIYLLGSTKGEFEATNSNGSNDSFLIKVDSELGEILDIKLYGTDHVDVGIKVIWSNKKLYIVGSLISGNGDPLTSDIALYEVNNNGYTNYMEYFATTKTDGATSAVIKDGHIYITGETSGAMYDGLPETRGKDFYILKVKLKE